MLNYINQPCPLCGKHMHGEDDIVVCPVCATPQHRECWMSEGHCVNEALHSPDYVWKPREEARIDEPEEENTVVCPSCGTKNPDGSFHCKSCGNLLGEEKDGLTCTFCGTENKSGSKICEQCGAPLIFESKFFDKNIYMNGINIPGDEAIGNTTAGEAALYIQNSARRYIPKFKKISSGKVISFNWAAFLFSPYWFFYRKLYKAGIILLVLFASITFMTYGSAQQLYDALQDSQSQITALQNEYKDKTGDENAMNEMLQKEEAIMNELTEKGTKPAAKLALVFFAEHLICGFIANYILYKRMCGNIEVIHSAQGDETLKKSLVMRAGGVSLLALAAGFLGSEIVTSLLSFIADKLVSVL